MEPDKHISAGLTIPKDHVRHLVHFLAALHEGGRKLKEPSLFRPQRGVCGDRTVKNGHGERHGFREDAPSVLVSARVYTYRRTKHQQSAVFPFFPG